VSDVPDQIEIGREYIITHSFRNTSNQTIAGDLNGLITGGFKTTDHGGGTTGLPEYKPLSLEPGKTVTVSEVFRVTADQSIFPRGLRHRFGLAGDTHFETPPTEFTLESSYTVTLTQPEAKTIQFHEPIRVLHLKP
jgi:hypothetical protein